MQSPPVYEGEGSDRISRGSVRVAKSGWWSGRIEGPADGEPAALLTIEYLAVSDETSQGRLVMRLPLDHVAIVPTIISPAQTEVPNVAPDQGRRRENHEHLFARLSETAMERGRGQPEAQQAGSPEK